jgi:FkbM family methyltransferase
VIRTLAERLSRGVVLRRRLPPSLGGATLYVSPECGGLRYWRFDTGSLDPMLFRAVERLVRPGDQVWDVGSNMGLFAFTAAARAGATGRVLAIEPDVDNARLLLRSCGAAPATAAPVHVLVCAVADQPLAFLDFEISSRARAANSLRGAGQSQKGAVRETRRVLAISLDELLRHEPPPAVVKIDVEGAEQLVLAGAGELLRSARPALAIEVSAATAREVEHLLRQARYRLFDGDAPGEAWREVEVPTWNCHAIPEERLGAFVPGAGGRLAPSGGLG